MATIPFTYQNNNPVIDPSLLPLQLALANYMAIGNPLAFAPNTRFMQAMKLYTNSVPLTPLTEDPRTGFPIVPAISRDIVGITYVGLGDDIYVYRRAQDCGPDENRFELAYIGKRAEVAFGTWAYYGPRVGSGRISDGSMLYDFAGIGTGGVGGGTTAGGGYTGGGWAGADGSAIGNGQSTDGSGNNSGSDLA